MLQIQHISKKYVTGKLVQKALDDVSLNLRDNEFVAILGPSGSGKSTLLNIIGGLDQYDSGDLIINGISTKRYSDRDWDSYRNHTIGFIFQSYNLIPHQTILSNVELALTISGIRRSERRQRAIEALEKVGLAEQMEKRPNQLSGGQMQRVAIARALVNNPDILLADEPTGALDSETSVQVMDLLKEVAEDRLVVMVTHNPELAEQYATRIVRVKDGQIQSDSRPFLPRKHQLLTPKHRNMGRSSMSRRMALALSFNNLRTKKARTLLTSFAGSIGIIGIAMILSLSTGVNQYIDDMEAKTMAGYPIQITNNTFDLSSFMGMSSDNGTTAEIDGEEINVIETMTSLFSTVETNDLNYFKSYLDQGKSGLDAYSSSIEYTYNVVPQLFLQNGSKINQVNPSSLSDSFSSFSMFSPTGSMNVFYQMPRNENLYKEQYEVLAGKWPSNEKEMILVLTQSGNISDLSMYALGLRDSSELDKMIKSFQEGKEVSFDTDFGTYSYDDILGTTYKLVNSADYYTYDKEFDVWTDKKENKSFLRNLVKKGEDIQIVGIVKPKEDASATGLSAGINYPYELTEHVIKSASGSKIVQDQLKHPKKNIFTGEDFGTERKNEFDLESLFTIDSEAISKAFQFDTSGLGSSLDTSSLAGSFQFDASALDFNGMVDLSDISIDMPDMPQIPLEQLLSGIQFNVSQDVLNQMSAELLAGYQTYVASHPEADFSNFSADFTEYLAGDGAGIVQDAINSVLSQVQPPTVTTDQLQGLLAEIVAAYMAQGYENFDSFGDFIYSDTVNGILANWVANNIAFDTSSIYITSDQLNALAINLASGYVAYAQSTGKPDPSKFGQYFLDYISTDSASAIISSGVASMIDTNALSQQISSLLGSYMNEVMSAYGQTIAASLGTQVNSIMEQIVSQLSAGMASAMTDMMSQIGSSLQNAFQIDDEAFAKAFSFNMEGDDFVDMLTSMSVSSSATYDSNLSSLGYVDLETPNGINIYPKDFESKEQITTRLDAYNREMELAGTDEYSITYTDLVGTLMSSVTTIVNSISYVLIAFVAISLLVSSIMIGVITYISVLERKKEIGILRAIGASKKNISQVFNAETGIIGFFAGIIGIGLTLLLLLPANMIIHKMSGNPDINAILPVVPAVVLIFLSILLTLIGGLIPSKKASRSDPVTALRTD
ncbi:MAG: ABC transporter ATP-binding protein/permease [Eubacteriales bacterium]|nr:ABC transporter ATP-binding protein/permease [Eubacteriales bacterium]